VYDSIDASNEDARMAFSSFVLLQSGYVFAVTKPESHMIGRTSTSARYVKSSIVIELHIPIALSKSLLYNRQTRPRNRIGQRPNKLAVPCSIPRHMTVQTLNDLA
jgi:hypothetical protein